MNTKFRIRYCLLNRWTYNKREAKRWRKQGLRIKYCFVEVHDNKFCKAFEEYVNRVRKQRNKGI